MLPQRFIRTVSIEIRGLCSASLHWPWDIWLFSLREALSRRVPSSPPLRRDGPNPHHRAGSAGPNDMGLGELAQHLAEVEQSQKPRKTSSATNQTHIMGLGLAHPSIYTIYNLLEYMKS